MRHRRSGFTLIELILAMSFVAVLLISIAMLTIEISHLYTRGLTMKEINQVGTEAANDLRTTMSAAYANEMSIKQESVNGGRKILCTGKYSYVMNDPTNVEQADNGTAPASTIKYTNNSLVRFGKVRDEGGVLCATPGFPSQLNPDAVELLGNGDRNLIVRKFSISPALGAVGADSVHLLDDFNNGRMLYTVNLTLGTGIASEIQDDQCKPPSEATAGGEYCGVDTFAIVVRVGNKKG